jgi:hypothetical protein
MTGAVGFNLPSSDSCRDCLNYVDRPMAELAIAELERTMEAPDGAVLAAEIREASGEGPKRPSGPA